MQWPISFIEKLRFTKHVSGICTYYGNSMHKHENAHEAFSTTEIESLPLQLLNLLAHLTKLMYLVKLTHLPGAHLQSPAGPYTQAPAGLVGYLSAMTVTPAIS